MLFRKHLLDGNKNLLGGFLHGKKKPALVSDPFDIRIFHRTNVRVAQTCQTREQKAGKNLPFLFFHRIEIVLQKLIKHNQFLGRQAFPESFLRFYIAKAEQFLYGMFDISFQASLAGCLFRCFICLTIVLAFIPMEQRKRSYPHTNVLSISQKAASGAYSPKVSNVRK